MKNSPELKSLISGRMFFLYVLVFLYSFVFQMLLTPLTTFGLSLGISAFVLGWIANSYEISCMIGRNPAGQVMDAGNFKRAVSIAFLVMTVNALLYMFVRTPVSYSLVRFLNGFTTGYVQAVFTALLPAAFKKEMVGTATAIYTAISTLGNSYAPALSKKLFDGGKFSKAYGCAACIGLGAFLLTVFFMPKDGLQVKEEVEADRPPEGDLSEDQKKRLFSGIAFSLFPVTTIGWLVNITKDMNSFYAVQLGIDKGIDVTTGIALAGTMAVFISILAGILIDRKLLNIVMGVCITCVSVSCFLYSGAKTASAATVAAVVYRIGIGGYWPSLVALCCKALPARRGTAIATLYFSLDLISFVNNTLLGWLYDSIGIGRMYAVIGIVNAVALPYFILVNKFYLSKKTT